MTNWAWAKQKQQMVMLAQKPVGKNGSQPNWNEPSEQNRNSAVVVVAWRKWWMARKVSSSLNWFCTLGRNYLKSVHHGPWLSRSRSRKLQHWKYAVRWVSFVHCRSGSIHCARRPKLYTQNWKERKTKCSRQVFRVSATLLDLRYFSLVSLCFLALFLHIHRL